MNGAPEYFMEVSLPHFFVGVTDREQEFCDRSMTSMSSSDSSASSFDEDADNVVLVDLPIDAASNTHHHSSFWIKYSTVIVHSSETALQGYLSGRPNTILKQS
jgi:hypothetical protein